MPNDLYVPGQRYRWVEWEEVGAEDEPAIRVKVRTSLTAAEFDSIKPAFEDKDLPVGAAYELIAPFVTDWNVAEVNDKGKVVKSPPPATAGGEAFEKIPNALFVRIAFAIRNTVLKPVDPKSLTLLAPTGTPTNGESTTPV